MARFYERKSERKESAPNGKKNESGTEKTGRETVTVRIVGVK